MSTTKSGKRPAFQRLTFSFPTDKRRAKWSRERSLKITMSVLLLEKFGYMIWEVLMLACLVFGTLGWLALRRKMSGRPAFSKQDRALLFNTPPAPVSLPKLCLRFVLAVLLFSCIGAIEMSVFAPLGAAILSVSLLVSCAAVVNMTLL
jgi:hypothetical protein